MCYISILLTYLLTYLLTSSQEVATSIPSNILGQVVHTTAPLSAFSKPYTVVSYRCIIKQVRSAVHDTGLTDSECATPARNA